MENDEIVAEPLKRYMVFYFDLYEENGGFGDYLCSADTLEEAVQKTIDHDIEQYKKQKLMFKGEISKKIDLFAFALGAHIVDSHIGKIVWEALKEQSKYKNYDTSM